MADLNTPVIRRAIAELLHEHLGDDLTPPAITEVAGALYVLLGYHSSPLHQRTGDDVPELWWSREWGAFEPDGEGAWRTVENGMHIETIPGDAVRLRPDLTEPAEDEGPELIDRGVCGHRGFAGAEGCIRAAGHDDITGHKYAGGKGELCPATLHANGSLLRCRRRPHPTATMEDPHDNLAGFAWWGSPIATLRAEGA